MRYVKPLIADLGPASAKIQGFGNKGILQVDANVMKRPIHSTGGCYDLDE